MIHGLDANIICHMLDPAFPEHLYCKRLLSESSVTSKLGVNPTVIHEAYHVLVYDQKLAPKNARNRIMIVLENPFIEYYNQSRKVSLLALNLAVHHKLKGRDSLILANYMMNKVSGLYSHDRQLSNKGEVTEKKYSIRIEDPVLSQR